MVNEKEKKDAKNEPKWYQYQEVRPDFSCICKKLHKWFICKVIVRCKRSRCSHLVDIFRINVTEERILFHSSKPWHDPIRMEGISCFNQRMCPKSDELKIKVSNANVQCVWIEGIQRFSVLDWRFDVLLQVPQTPEKSTKEERLNRKCVWPWDKIHSDFGPRRLLPDEWQEKIH